MLESKVNKLLVIHELDALLTPEEKKLVDEVNEDIDKKKRGKFVSVDEI